MALVRYCAICKQPVHYIMPWMKNHRIVRSGKYKGRIAHKIDRRTRKCKCGD